MLSSLNKVDKSKKIKLLETEEVEDPENALSQLSQSLAISTKIVNNDKALIQQTSWNGIKLSETDKMNEDATALRQTFGAMGPRDTFYEPEDCLKIEIAYLDKLRV